MGIAICDTTSKTRRIAVPIVTTWLVNLGELIFLSVVTLILSVYTIWSSIRARRKNKAAASVVRTILFAWLNLFKVLCLTTADTIGTFTLLCWGHLSFP